MAGLGGPAAAAVGAVTLTGVSPVVTGLMPVAAAGAVGAVTLTGVPSVVTGFMPLAAAGAAGILGRSFKYLIILCDVGFYQEYLPCFVSAP